jgi:hypothetical protein
VKLNFVQCVTIEVNLEEGDEEPEQHLDDGEFIERRVVPLTELYDTLKGMLYSLQYLFHANKPISTLQGARQDCRRKVCDPNPDETHMR